MSIAFDTLEYANELKAAGFTDLQAEAQAKALARIVQETLTTKQDLRDLEYRLTIKLGGMMTASIALVAAIVKLF